LYRPSHAAVAHPDGVGPGAKFGDLGGGKDGP
jgi:hypothetical protein